MKILFLGSFLPNEYEARFKELSAAANQYQYNLYNSLKKDNEVKVMSYITVPGVVLNDEDKAYVEKLSFDVFIPKRNGFAEFLKFRCHLTKMLEWAEYVISYNVLYPWLFLGNTAQKAKTKSCLILADYTPVAEEKKISKKLYSYFMGKSFNTYDRIIALSQGSKHYIHNKNKVTVVNGCIKWNLFKDFEFKFRAENAPYYIVYTGFIGKVTGVDLLLEAFHKLKYSHVRLVVCGQGHELDDMLTTYTKRDSRIEYKGYLSKEEYFEVLNMADLLINPRNMNLLQNQNNFPSKILEYLATGKTIVSTKFMDFDKYTGKMIFVESDKDAIRSGILRAISLSEHERQNIYAINRDFAQRFDWDKMKKYFL